MVNFMHTKCECRLSAIRMKTGLTNRVASITCAFLLLFLSIVFLIAYNNNMRARAVTQVTYATYRLLRLTVFVRARRTRTIPSNTFNRLKWNFNCTVDGLCWWMKCDKLYYVVLQLIHAVGRFQQNVECGNCSWKFRNSNDHIHKIGFESVRR